MSVLLVAEVHGRTGLESELRSLVRDLAVHHVSATVHALDPNPPDPGLLG
jgi:hypothetical protein